MTDYWTNVYSVPEKFGLTIIGCIDFSDGCYQFDYTVVWQDEAGQLYFADDAGCSCPSPFETYTSVDQITPCTPTELQHHLEMRAEEETGYHDNSDEGDCYATQIADLMGRIRESQLAR